MKIIQDIWILDKAGVAIFHRAFEKTISPQMFGAMMSALHMFAEELTEGGLSNFELNERKYTIIKKSGLLFVVNSSKNHKQKKVNRELERISKKFLKLYSEQLKNFKGETGAFEEFTSVIENALEDKNN